MNTFIVAGIGCYFFWLIVEGKKMNKKTKVAGWLIGLWSLFMLLFI